MEKALPVLRPRRRRRKLISLSCVQLALYGISQNACFVSILSNTVVIANSVQWSRGALWTPLYGVYASECAGATMSCFMNAEEREQLQISREIQKRLDQDKKQSDKELKLLLLGKSTVPAVRKYSALYPSLPPPSQVPGSRGRVLSSNRCVSSTAKGTPRKTARDTGLSSTAMW